VSRAQLRQKVNQEKNSSGKYFSSRMLAAMKQIKLKDEQSASRRRQLIAANEDFLTNPNVVDFVDKPLLLAKCDKRPVKQRA
jgi:hypothetical protein